MMIFDSILLNIFYCIYIFVHSGHELITAIDMLWFDVMLYDRIGLDTIV